MINELYSSQESFENKCLAELNTTKKVFKEKLEPRRFGNRFLDNTWKIIFV